MLYTTYSHYTILNKLSDNMRKILIMKWIPKFLDTSKYNLEHEPNLAPSSLLLARYKDGKINTEQFFEIFKEEMLEDDFQKALDDIKNDLDKGKDVVLICCEKDRFACHRHVIATELSRQGYECKEL